MVAAHLVATASSGSPSVVPTAPDSRFGVSGSPFSLSEYQLAPDSRFGSRRGVPWAPTDGACTAVLGYCHPRWRQTRLSAARTQMRVRYDSSAARYWRVAGAAAGEKVRRSHIRDSATGEGVGIVAPDAAHFRSSLQTAAYRVDLFDIQYAQASSPLTVRCPIPPSPGRTSSLRSAGGPQ